MGEALGERWILLLPQSGHAARRMGRTPGLCAKLHAAFAGGDPGRSPAFGEGAESKRVGAESVFGGPGLWSEALA